MGNNAKVFSPVILEGYFIADQDADASPNYYGFVRADGVWYILRETLSPGADVYEYARGTGSTTADSYETNWTNRVSLTTYARYHLVNW